MPITSNIIAIAIEQYEMYYYYYYYYYYYITRQCHSFSNKQCNILYVVSYISSLYFTCLFEFLKYATFTSCVDRGGGDGVDYELLGVIGLT